MPLVETPNFSIPLSNDQMTAQKKAITSHRMPFFCGFPSEIKPAITLANPERAHWFDGTLLFH